MSDATPSRPSADRNLLLGILALQMDFISRDALIAAMNAWVLDKGKPLGQILVKQHALRADQHGALEVLVNLHLEQHEGDVDKSLAALGVPAPVRQELHSLGDGDVDASLARVPTPPHASSAMPSTTPEKPGAFGLRYHVLRPHGKGGIGEVFVALDQELNREVALKEIQDRHADDEPSRSRFVREAEITGGLEHPGIVPVYGLGQYGDGRPYYAMRFIQGETLKDAIARYHRSPLAPREEGQPLAEREGYDGRSPEFELRALLTRFVAVCNTIAYAHSRGVIHRDIKPANIMLGKYGETLVVDWGMAKAVGSGQKAVGSEAVRSTCDGLPEPALVPRLADGVETQAGAALGTPSYMSPEQALGRLDQLGPASDIYSQGATLYCVLTGRPPIEGMDTAEILRKAQRGEWLPPRQIKSDAPPALDAICRKAIALHAGQRYATALELAADVERWLADEPVVAWPEPWTVRAQRWARRHKALVTSAAALLVTVAPGVIIGAMLLRQAQKATEDQRIAYQIESARYYQQLGRRLHAMGQPAGALDAFRQGVSIGEELRQAAPENIQALSDLAESYSNLSHLYQETGNVEEGARACREGLLIAESLAKENPTIPELQAKLGDALFELALVQRLQNDFPSAKESFQKAIAVWKQLAADNPDVTLYQFELGKCHWSLGNLQCDTGDLDAAMGSGDAARKLLEGLAKVEQRNSSIQAHLATSYIIIGKVHMKKMDKPEKSLQALERAAGILEMIAPRYEPMLNYYNLACARALASSVIAGQGKSPLPASEGPKKSQQYADQAMEALRQSATAGWRNADELANDPDLQALKLREDFESLLAEMKKRQ